MEEVVVYLFFLLLISALVSLLGRNRKIGFGWSFAICVLVSPAIAIFFILRSKKKNKIEYTEIKNINKNPS